jgi:hypothetical protein
MAKISDNTAAALAELVDALGKEQDFSEPLLQHDLAICTRVQILADALVSAIDALENALK